MIKAYAVLTLKHLLSGVPEEYQNIFTNLTKVEEICYEDEESTTAVEEGDKESNKHSGSDDERDSKESGINERTDEAAITKESKVTAKTKTTRKVTVQELTCHGKRFINTMMDQAQATNLDELSYTELENYRGYCNPAINFSKLLDIKSDVYLNENARMYGGDRTKVVEFPNHDIDNMEFYTDEEDEILPFMTAQEYNDTWKLIMDASKVEGMTTSLVNTKLKKTQQYMDDIKVAYYNDKQCQVFGSVPTRDDKILAYLTQPKWLVDGKQFLITTQEVPVLDELMLKQWLCSPTGSSQRNGSNDNKPRRGGKKDELSRKQRDKKKKAKDQRATDLNPNHNDSNNNNDADKSDTK